MKQKLIYISGKMGEKVLSAATIEKFQRAQDVHLRTGSVDCVMHACDGTLHFSSNSGEYGAATASSVARKKTAVCSTVRSGNNTQENSV